jgi:hypothetical protein
MGGARGGRATRVGAGRQWDGRRARGALDGDRRAGTGPGWRPYRRRARGDRRRRRGGAGDRGVHGRRRAPARRPRLAPRRGRRAVQGDTPATARARPGFVAVAPGPGRGERDRRLAGGHLQVRPAPGAAAPAGRHGGARRRLAGDQGDPVTALPADLGARLGPRRTGCSLSRGRTIEVDAQVLGPTPRRSTSVGRGCCGARSPARGGGSRDCGDVAGIGSACRRRVAEPLAAAAVAGRGDGRRPGRGDTTSRSTAVVVHADGGRRSGRNHRGAT